MFNPGGLGQAGIDREDKAHGKSMGAWSAKGAGIDREDKACSKSRGAWSAKGAGTERTRHVVNPWGLGQPKGLG